jgi:hypothetical protein
VQTTCLEQQLEPGVVQMNQGAPQGSGELAAAQTVAVGDKIVAVDLFDNPPTCRKVWRRLLSGFILDGMSKASEAARVTESAVVDMLTTMRNSTWEKVTPIGEGEEYRAQSEDGIQVSALAFAGSLIHGSLFTGA